MGSDGLKDDVCAVLLLVGGVCRVVGVVTGLALGVEGEAVLPVVCLTLGGVDCVSVLLVLWCLGLGLDLCCFPDFLDRAKYFCAILVPASRMLGS